MVQPGIDELRASDTLRARRQFIILSAVVFLTAFLGIHALGAEPEPIKDMNAKVLAFADLRRLATTAEVPVVEESIERGVPTGISIPKIGLNAGIVNPSSTSISALDTALEKGVVRYPGSAYPGEKGTVFLFGHSSGLPVVNNQNYKVFNNLWDLSSGDLIVIRSKDRAYSYRVTSVSLVTDSNAVVEFQTNERKLVLATCNTFGKKQDRYVVSADFVESYPVTTF